MRITVKPTWLALILLLLFVWFCEFSRAWLSSDSRLVGSQMLVGVWWLLTSEGAGEGENRLMDGGRGVCCSVLLLRFGGGGDRGLSFANVGGSLLGGHGRELVLWKSIKYLYIFSLTKFEVDYILCYLLDRPWDNI